MSTAVTPFATPAPALSPWYTVHELVTEPEAWEDAAAACPQALEQIARVRTSRPAAFGAMRSHVLMAA